MGKELDNIAPGAIRRDLSEADFPLIIAFEDLTTFQRNDTPPDHAATPFTLEELEDIKSKGAIFGGIFDEKGEMLAQYIFSIKPPEELYIEEIAVHPNHRDKGLGTYLLELADQEAGSRGLARCTLSVDPLNGRGVNAYLKHGYRITDYRKAYFGPEHPNTDRFWMVKQFHGEKNDFAEDIKEVVCGDSQGLQAVLRDGYIGVSLIRGVDNMSNRIVFRK